MRNREFVFTPKIEYELVAERSETNQNRLQFPTWCPRRESNSHLQVRSLTFYPLNYGGGIQETSDSWLVIFKIYLPHQFPEDKIL